MQYKDFYSHLINESGEYRIDHTAPDHLSGAPLYDLTLNGIYPKDVYEYDAVRMYSTGEDRMDRQAYSIIQSLRGKQNAYLIIYRSVPKEVKDKQINVGDWVSIVKDYVIEHGEANWGKGKYKILKRRVYARDIFTDGDSWLEWGYDPQPRDEEYSKNRYIERQTEYIKRIERGDKIAGLNKYPTDAWYGKDAEFIDKLKNDIEFKK